MKIAFFLGILGMFFPMKMHSQEIASDSEKIYVEPDQIFLQKNEISALIEGEWIPIQSIHLDTDGLYVKPMVHNYPWSRWLCPACGYNNSGYSKTCQREYPDGSKCGHPRPE